MTDPVVETQEMEAQRERRRDREKKIAKRWLMRRYKIDEEGADQLVDALHRKYSSEEGEAPFLDFLKWLIVYVVESGLLDLLIGLLEAGEPLDGV